MRLVLIISVSIAAYLGFAVLVGKIIAFGTGGHDAGPTPMPANQHRRDGDEDARRGARKAGAGPR